MASILESYSYPLLSIALPEVEAENVPFMGVVKTTLTADMSWQLIVLRPSSHFFGSKILSKILYVSSSTC